MDVWMDGWMPVNEVVVLVLVLVLVFSLFFFFAVYPQFISVLCQRPLLCLFPDSRSQPRIGRGGPGPISSHFIFIDCLSDEKTVPLLTYLVS